VQAIFTELFHDEAYYWKYSQNLAWGYFDHPPMIALVVKLGYLLFQNELGVRLVIVLMNTATIYLIEKIIIPKNQLLYYVLIASIVLLHYGGSLAIPDNPLLFFTATFYYIYQRYTLSENWKWMLLLGVNAAALMYSKYHGALVILATLISNPKLLPRIFTWLALALALLLYLPHLLWQFEHVFPSVKYQLFSRSVAVFDFMYVLEFIFTQPLIYGPIVGFLLLFFAFRSKPDGDFEKALKYNVVIVFSIFFISTFKGKVEAHWTDISLIPLLYFGYKGIESSAKLQKFVFRTFPISLALMLFLRIFLMVDFLPASWNIKTEFHGWDDWAEEIKSSVTYEPVIFDNTYQNTSKFEFYSGMEAICLTNKRGRMNQYDIWMAEESAQGKDVTFLPWINNDDLELIETAQGIFRKVDIPNYRTYPGFSIIIDRDKATTGEREPLQLKLTFVKDSLIDKPILKNGETAELTMVIFDAENKMSHQTTGHRVTEEMIRSGKSIDIEISLPGSGKYAVYFTITNSDFPPTVHSYPLKITAE
jgi:uncharacterized membrane protein YjfL (UPF0719 family)